MKNSYELSFTMLEKVQAHYIRAAGFDVDEFIHLAKSDSIDLLKQQVVEAEEMLKSLKPGDLRSKIEDFLRQFAHVRQQVPIESFSDAWNESDRPISRLQRIDDYRVLLGFKNDILANLFKNNNPRDNLSLDFENVILATAPMGRCNAFIFSDLNRQQFSMVMDDQIIATCFSMSQIIADLIDFDGQDIVWNVDLAREKINKYPQHAVRFAEMISNFLIRGASHQATPFLIEDDRALNFAYAVSWLGCIFMVGHELGHVACGHLNDNGTRYALSHGQPTPEAVFLQRCETEADIFGAMACCASGKASGNEDGSLSAVAQTLILYVYAYIYRIIAIRAGHTASLSLDADVLMLSTNSHPSPIQRIRAVHGRYNQKTNDNIAAQALQFVEVVLEHLWTVTLTTHGATLFNKKLHSRWLETSMGMQSSTN